MIPKEIMKLYEKLAFSRGYEEAFRDFLDVCLYYLSVGMLAEDYRRVEKRYKPYEMELFVQMFYRVSEYSEGFCDVLGDMPRSVFKLLWDTVQSGNEIFAYVINRSANGDHYWVFAHVTPSYDMRGRMVGFHSNRRVANKRIVEGTIIPLYDMLRAEEARHTNPKEAAEAGVALLNRILNDKGVRYDEFIFSLLRAA